MRGQAIVSNGSQSRSEGFSLLELLVSVVVITLLMAMVFRFLDTNQRRYRSQQLLSVINQGGRSAFEIIAQELHQAGYNPPLPASKSLGGATNPIVATGGILSLTITGGGTPVTKGLFYGTRLVIGNNCTGAPGCDQEEVLVNQDTSYGTTAMTTTTIPVVITNNHATLESVYSRNYPYPTGILYDNRTAGVGLGITDNKLRFYGDILNTDDIYYGEYRLQCPGAAAGTYVDACTTGCMQGPFLLTRFITRLANAAGVFYIPTSRTTVTDGATPSPLVDNIQGSCASTVPGYTWPFNAPDETAAGGVTAVNRAVSYAGGATTIIDPVVNPDETPAIWYKINTYGAYDNSTTPPTPLFQTFVVDVTLVLTVQEAAKDPETGTVRTERLQTHIVPRNINDALTIANNGGSSFLPTTPIDPSHDCTGTAPNLVCPTLPLP